MTIFLCVVIFSETAMDPSKMIDSNGDRNNLGQIFFYINYFLLTFFVIEIFLKVFADGFLFMMEFINVFDSCVVFISFAF